MSKETQASSEAPISAPIVEDILPELPAVGGKPSPQAVQLAHRLRKLRETDLDDDQIAWLARYERRVAVKRRLKVTSPDGSTLDYGDESDTSESTSLASVVAPLTAHIQKFTDDAFKHIREERKLSVEVDKQGYEQVLEANKALLQTVAGMSKYVETLHNHRENMTKNEREAQEQILALMEKASGVGGWMGSAVEIVEGLAEIAEKFGGVGNISAAWRHAAERAKVRRAASVVEVAK